MTITISTTALYFFYYWAIAFIVELIKAIFSVKKIKKQLGQNPTISGLLAMVKSNPALSIIKNILSSPPMYIIYATVIFLAAPLTFLFTVLGWIRSIIMSKPKAKPQNQPSRDSLWKEPSFEDIDVPGGLMEFELDNIDEIPSSKKTDHKPDNN